MSHKAVHVRDGEEESVLPSSYKGLSCAVLQACLHLPGAWSSPAVSVATQQGIEICRCSWSSRISTC